MFSASAEFYDLIYSSFKDYPAESAQIAATIRGLNPAARSILDAACGTAEHARLLVENHGFEVDGLDLDEAFVRIAQTKLSAGTVYHGDITSFALPKRYDVVLCLFSAIGYVRTVSNVVRTLQCFRNHLTKHGVVIVEPWFPPGMLEPGRVFVKTGESEGISVCRMSHLTVDGSISRLRFEYLIGRPEGIERASEIHELGLFTQEEMLGAFREAGLVPTYDPKGLMDRGLYVAHKS